MSDTALVHVQPDLAGPLDLPPPVTTMPPVAADQFAIVRPDDPEPPPRRSEHESRAWEHCVAECNDHLSFIAQADKLGADRWELVHLDTIHGFTVGFFKRVRWV